MSAYLTEQAHDSIEADRAYAELQRETARSEEVGATHQASRAAHQGSPPGSGMAGIEADVLAVPPDKDALALVQAILEQTKFDPHAPRDRLAYRLGLIQRDAERLAELLKDRDEAVEEMVPALEKCALIPCPEYRQNNTDCIIWAAKPCGPCMARRARGRYRGGTS